MGSFHGPLAEGDILRRYDLVEGTDEDNRVRDIDGAAVRAWTTFTEALGASQLADWRSAFSTFVLAVRMLQRPAGQPRVFVSHRQLDIAVAEQIAWQATQAGKDYWLDAHDATLIRANKLIPSTDPRYALVIAGIIEMALLSCTHVIAAHTKNSLGSKWIPYELARAKGRQVISHQAAGWFDRSIQDPRSQGEYVVLANILRTQPDVDHWLGPPQGVRPYRGRPNPPPTVFK